MVCERKRINQVKLCRGDLKHQIRIVKRELQPSGFDSIQPNEVFTAIASPWCAIETLGGGLNRGSQIFRGINIDPDATHIFWLTDVKGLPAIETAYFIEYEGIRYRILQLTNINELNWSLAIQATNRGTASLEASQA